MTNRLLDRLAYEMPITLGEYDLSGKRAGLIIVDENNGFCTPGAGNLAPRGPDARVEQMIDETDRLAHAFQDADRPIFVFLDTHEPGRPEPPFPPHCERGTGEELIVEKLAWLRDKNRVAFCEKDCISGFVGAIQPRTQLYGGHLPATFESNELLGWISSRELETVVIVGICTDICDLDLVLPLLSARNHVRREGRYGLGGGPLLPTLKDVVVYEPGCATYDLPRSVAEAAGLSPTSAHPRELAHHVGLWTMQMRGAVLANKLLC